MIGPAPLSKKVSGEIHLQRPVEYRIPKPDRDDMEPIIRTRIAAHWTTLHCLPERSEGPGLLAVHLTAHWTTLHCLPERSEGPGLFAVAPPPNRTTLHCHSERSEGPGLLAVISQKNGCFNHKIFAKKDNPESST